jgi:hypothetical protein
VNPKTATRLYNETCPYCGAELKHVPFDKDHVIGRRFVPKGKLHQSWNLFVNACTSCNNKKSELEDDLSALTMQPDAFGEYATDDARLHEESKRKGAKSVNRRSNKPVADSWDTKVLSSPLAGGSLSFSLIVPPQPDHKRAASLAGFHVGALFYWITYNEQSKRGGFWPGDGVVTNVAFRRDWGNSIQRSFEAQARNWESRLQVVTADGYFKAAIRRAPKSICWSWALEWNHSIRLIGFFGEEAGIDQAASNIALPKAHVFVSGTSSITRIREEHSLEPVNDRLFDL